MFELTKTFTHTTGFRITPIEMQGVGFVFLPKELENQLGYEDLSRMIVQSDSFSEGMEYIVLKNSNLQELKMLLNRVHIMDSVYISQSLKHSSALIVLTEPGLYTVMILSRKTNAVAFRRWVTGEVLPSIRKTGMYKIPGIAPVTAGSELLPELVNKVISLERNIARLFADQKQFQQYALRGFERIEAVLADSQPHDMFEGWRKIKGLVDDVTAIYGLSNMERKRYLRELCQAHQVHLPEKALLESEPLFHDAQEIAVKIGLYSATKKPHTRLVGALIRHLGLDQDQYCRKFPVSRRGYTTTVPKYSDNVIPHILEWLKEKNYPETVEIGCGEAGKIWKFRVRYRSISRIS